MRLLLGKVLAAEGGEKEQIQTLLSILLSRGLKVTYFSYLGKIVLMNSLNNSRCHYWVKINKLHYS